MSNPGIYIDGEPDNIEAVVADSLSWLRFIQADLGIKLDAKDRKALARMIFHLRRFAPVELEFRDREVSQ